MALRHTYNIGKHTNNFPISYIEDLEDMKRVKPPIKKIILKWILDDNNKNILYKTNGDERYPDFKLYKMIARNVHNHVPSKVLENPHFDKYLISKKRIF